MRSKAKKAVDKMAPPGMTAGEKMDTAAEVLALAEQTADQAIADAKREAQEILDRARREAEQIIADARTRARGPEPERREMKDA